MNCIEGAASMRGTRGFALLHALVASILALQQGEYQHRLKQGPGALERVIFSIREKYVIFGQLEKNKGNLMMFLRVVVRADLAHTCPGLVQVYSCWT